MTTDNRAFGITLFPDRRARTMRAIQVSEPGLIVPTLDELINSATAPTKERLPLLRLASFGPTKSAQGCFRHEANIKLVNGVEIDCEPGMRSPADRGGRAI